MTTPAMPQAPVLRTYVINLDGTTVNFAAFHRYLLDSRDIVKYWNYIPGSYFVKSFLIAPLLQVKISDFVPSGFFVVAEVNPYNMQGRLPQEAWNWFYETPPAAHSLLDYFKQNQ